MGKKINDKKLDEEERIRKEKLNELEEMFKCKCCCGIRVHKLVFLVALLCLVFDGMSFVNIISKQSFKSEIGPLVVRTLINLLLLYGSLKEKKWFYWPFIVTKGLQLIVTVIYTIYLIFTSTKLLPSWPSFDHFVGLQHPEDTNLDTLAGVFIGLGFVFSLLLFMVIVTWKGYNYLQQKEEIQKMKSSVNDVVEVL